MLPLVIFINPESNKKVVYRNVITYTDLRVSSSVKRSRIANYDTCSSYACRKWVARVHPTGSKLILRLGRNTVNANRRVLLLPQWETPRVARVRPHDSSNVAPLATVASVETMLHLHRIPSLRRPGSISSLVRATTTECKLVISWLFV